MPLASRPGSISPFRGRSQARTVDAVDVADAVVALETCPSVVPAHCPALRRARERNPLDGWPTWNVTARLYRFSNVVLDRTHMVLLHDGRIVAQTNYLQPAEALADLRVRTADLVRVDPGPPAAICFDHWDGNFYHWTAHTIPALHAISRRTQADSGDSQSGTVRLVLPRLQPWQRAWLSLAGADRLPSITAEAGRQYLFPAVDYFDITSGSLDFAVSALSRDAYARLAAGVAEQPPQRGAKIYVERTGSANRSVRNEADLVARLRDRGFICVRPELLPVAEQLALFAGAAMVVGLHGAGLANIAWCKPATVVYELIPSHHINPCYMVMALQGGLTYWADMFDSGVAGSDHYAACTRDLDVEAVLQRVDELEEFAKR